MSGLKRVLGLPYVCGTLFLPNTFSIRFQAKLLNPKPCIKIGEYEIIQSGRESQ